MKELFSDLKKVEIKRILSDKIMIVVNIKNGLGNQMFQYAFGKVLSWKYNCPVYFDLLRDGDTSPLVTDLDVFTIDDIPEASFEDVKQYRPFSVRQFRDNKQYFKYIYYKLKRMLQPDRLITEPFPSLYMDIFNNLNLKKNYYFLGFWQNPRFFEGYEDRIRHFFLPSNPAVLQTKIANEIINSKDNTVSLHFRRGDYQTSGFLAPLEMEYYHQAIQLIKEKIDKPFFYIFTDEPEWVEQNFKSDIRYKLVSENRAEHSYIDILLMSKCKSHIMANSTFSWWGAWLDANPDKLVIAPKKWYAYEDLNKYTHEITPESWMRI